VVTCRVVASCSPVPPAAGTLMHGIGDSSVGIATDHEMNDLDSILARAKTVSGADSTHLLGSEGKADGA
jgi:hypothetical protein